jgi:hypothetical protein
MDIISKAGADKRANAEKVQNSLVDGVSGLYSYVKL